jgi:hypothetical protein
MAVTKKRPARKPAECHDCGEDWPEFFRVHNAVWKEAVGAEWRLILCVSCLEERLGRRLTIADFDAKAPVNEMLFYGYTLRKNAEFCSCFSAEEDGHG